MKCRNVNRGRRNGKRDGCARIAYHVLRIIAVMGFSAIRRRMDETGIGYAGIEGAWWLPATAPFALPPQTRNELQHIAEATFALFDAVSELYSRDAALRDLLNYKVPAHLLSFASKQRVLSVRPDFQLRLQTSGVFEDPRSEAEGAETPEVSFVATELEICPSAQGYAHAMQMGYDLRPDLVGATVRVLDGRTLLFAGTREWSAFIWEQLAFCRALEAHGAKGRVWFDAPVETLAESWQPPMFGVAEKPARWNVNMPDRLKPFEDLLLRELPARGEGLTLFRFGYLDCFAPEVLHQLAALERTSAVFLNPLHFAFDSKAILAALRLPGVRSRIGLAHCATLDAAIPETRVLTEALLPQLAAEQADWVLKFAGFDRGQQAWGGRSLQVGALVSKQEWASTVERYCDLPFPVVAQRAMPTATLEAHYFDLDGATHRLRGPSRVRSFFLRDGAQVIVGGSHVTISPGAGGVSEGTNAMQSPIAFAGTGW
jgi:hypothetical protein